MNTGKLKKLFNSSTDRYGDARKMGTTYQNISRIIDGADLKVSTLEGIAKFYNVPVGYFFDEAEADGRKSHDVEIAKLKGKIEVLKEAIRLLRDDNK
jgi:transcriptional regulator with XRE-family HTH domain